MQPKTTFCNHVLRTSALLAALTAAPLVAANPLPNAVASGDTTDTSTWLWARPGVAGDVTFVYGTDPALASGTDSFVLNTANPALPVKALVDGLTPGTTYYYSATDANGHSSTGTFKTAYNSGYNGVRFGVTGDWRGEIGPFPAVTNVPDRQLDFFVSHGDTIYADFASPYSDGFLNPAQAITLGEFRTKHDEVYSARYGLNALGDVRASTSLLVTIDDHEVTNDFGGGGTIGSDPRFGAAFPGDDPNALINDSTLYENGMQAFQEYNPVADEFYGETGDTRTANERKLYRARTYGQDAAIFVLDNRSFRDQAVANPDGTTPQTLGATLPTFIAESNDPTRTMLGAQQLADLKADLLTAQDEGVSWKFIAVPEPMQSLGPLIGPADRFDGYIPERNDILNFIDDNGIENVVFISADIHGNIVNEIVYTDPDTNTEVVSSAWGITTGSVGFDQPFGQSVFNVAAAGGLLSAQEQALYDALPFFDGGPEFVPGIATKDDFIEAALNDLALAPFDGTPGLAGISLIGLDEGVIPAELLQGDYFNTHFFSWTEFEVDAETQELLVTTYGILPNSDLDFEGEPGVIDTDDEIALLLAQQPEIVSQFVVSVVPEPGTIALLALGGLMIGRRRR